MKVEELISILQKMPEGTEVEVNDNNGGNVYSVDSVDFFVAEMEEEYSVIVIQVNCD